MFHILWILILLQTITSMCSASVGLNCNVTSNCHSMPTNYTCSNGTCKCADGYKEDENTFSCRKSSYGELCTQNASIACEDGLSCNSITSNCLCNTTTQFWLDGCYSLENIRVTLRNNSIIRQATDIHLAWSVPLVNITGVSFRIVSDNGTDGSANSTGGTVFGLEPGTKYNFTIVSIPPSDNYTVYNNVSVTTGSFWTYPAQPGLSGVPHLVNNTNAYEVNVVASVGSVNRYRMILYDNGTVIERSNSTNSTVLLRGLTPGKIYEYFLFAENENGDISQYTTGPISTRATASHAIKNMTIADVTDVSITISWHKPQFPNGNITAYEVLVNLGARCEHNYMIKCTGCVGEPAIFNRSTCVSSTVSNRTAHDFEQTLSVELLNLKPYRDYIICMAAANEAGLGWWSCLDASTKSGTPYMVTNVTVVQTRLLNTVGFNISWIRGDFIGPTVYKVLLKDKSNANGINITTGINFTAVHNLLAYWDYNISIQAVTDTGVSNWTQPLQAKTSANVPGLAAFTLIQDKDIANKLTLNIQCPDEKNRSGIISKYLINKLNMNNSNSENQTVVNDAIDCNRNTSVQLTNILPEQSYQIKVLVQNHEFSGYFSDPVFVDVQPKPPILNVPGTETIKPTSFATQSQVQVTLCVDCILNNTLIQGNLTDAGLIVCLDVPNSQCSTQSSAGRKRRSATEKEGFNITWFESKENNFALQYRTTPDDWLQTLQGKALPKSRSSTNDLTYTIGNEQCKNEKKICNGPLPPGTEVSISLTVCNAGGCGRSLPQVVQTQALKSEEVSTSSLIGGLVGGMLGLVLIFAVAIVVMYWKRQSVRAKIKITEMTSLPRLKMENIQAIAGNFYSSPSMSTSSYSHQYDDLRDSIYASPKELYDEIPPDYDYDDVIV